MSVPTNTILTGDCLEIMKTLPDNSINCCITSPPYFGLRDYGMDGQIGLEPTPEDYVSRLVEVFREVKRVLRDDGTFWLNLGDSYVSSGVQTPQKNLNALADRMAPRKNPRKTNQDVDGKVIRPNKIKPENMKMKDLMGIPWIVAFALRNDGWYLRQDIIWSKPNPMPESVNDRCTKSHEYIFLLTKNSKYFFDHYLIKEPVAESTIIRAKHKNNHLQRKDGGDASNQCGLTPEQQDKYYAKINESALRNKRSVWTITTRSFKGAHFATFPEDLIKPCILAGCPEEGIVLDPFFGAGTTGLVSLKLNRQFLGIELNPEYVEIAKARIASLPTNLSSFQ